MFISIEQKKTESLTLPSSLHKNPSFLEQQISPFSQYPFELLPKNLQYRLVVQ